MKPMKQTPSRMSLAEVEALNRRDRNRLILLVVAAVLLGAGVFGTRLVGGKYEEQAELGAPPIARPQEPLQQVVTFPFKDEETLARIADATPEERLALSDEPLTSLLLYSQTLRERNYDALGIRDLDAALCAEIAADPAAQRVKPFRARGFVEYLSKRKRQGTSIEEHYGTLRLEDDARVHIVFVAPPEDPIEVDDFVRLDGIFVQLYRTEVAGVWQDAPLIAGRSVQPSYPRCTGQERGELLFSLRTVADDRLEDVSGLPDGPLWNLMAYARERADEIDWDDPAIPELNSEVLHRILEHGEEYRGRPFRVPISKNMGSYTLKAGENCLRLERRTEGWIGNFMWTGAVPLIKFWAPFDWPEFADYQDQARLLSGRGFFFKNHYYTRGKHGEPAVAPLFVLTDLQIFTPPPDTTTQYILRGVLGGTVFIICLIWFLLRQEKRRAAELQAELIRRRRARRGQAEAT